LSTVLRRARLPVSTKREVVDFISSREADRRIARSIVLVNEAHVAALLKAKLVSRDESRKLLRELQRMENVFHGYGIDEDFHLYVEEQLTKRLGPRLGGKLHTGKSRNDQVATAIRMTLRESLLDLSISLLTVTETLLRQSRKYANALFVSYTHQQPAQPITYGHYLLSIADSLLRDGERIFDCYGRVNMSPMGSGAIAGSSFDLDRRFLAQRLGFDALVENSLDGVGSRDFLLESLGVCSLTASDLSRVAQDLIFYSSADVNLLDLPPEYSSTSSIMPQKKNPDPLELVRSRCAGVNVNYTTATTIVHALLSGYNLDFQELTPLLWHSIDTLQSCLSIVKGMISQTRPVDGIADRPQVQFTVATEVANSLVRETGAPFRDAYRWVGQAVRTALDDNRTLKDLTRSEWSKITGKQVDQKTYRVLLNIADPRSNPRTYRTLGSPNPREIRRMISSRRRIVLQHFQKIKKLRDQIGRSTGRKDRSRNRNNPSFYAWLRTI
jgi:argininosuccinate lyase